VKQMFASVKTLLDLAPNVDLVLPGHNEPLKGALEVEKAAKLYIASVGMGRVLRKGLSRVRASILMSAYAANLPLVSSSQLWLRN